MVTRRMHAAGCFVEIDSDDELGESALAFNHLVEALTFSHQTEAAVRGFNEVLTSQLGFGGS